MTLRSLIVLLCLLVFSTNAQATSEKKLWNATNLDELVGRRVLMHDRRCATSAREAKACLLALRSLTLNGRPSIRWVFADHAPQQTIRSFKNIHITDQHAKPSPEDRDAEIEALAQYAQQNFRVINDIIPFILVWAYDEMVEEQTIPYATSVMLNTYYRNARDVYTHIELSDALNKTVEAKGQNFVGIGVMLEELDSGLLIMDILPESPAERAGLRMGDRIVKVDDVEIEDDGKRAVSLALVGKENSNVMVNVIRGGKSVRLLANRQRLDFQFVDSRTIETSIGRIAHIQISTFLSNHICEEVTRAIDHAEANDYAGIILDVRNNGGGLLPQATCIADKLVKKHLPLLHQVPARKGEQEVPPTMSIHPMRTDLPVVLLQNEASASASEVLAVILQDHLRAAIIGTLSFGKGIVQTSTAWINKEPVIRDHSVAGVEMFYTTHFYKSPVTKRYVQHAGLAPNYRVREDNPEIPREQDNEGSPKPPVSVVKHAPSNDPVMDRCMAAPVANTGEIEKDTSNPFVARAIQYFVCQSVGA